MSDPKIQAAELSKKANEALKLDYVEGYGLAESLFSQAFELDIQQPLEKSHARRATDYAWVLKEQSKFDEARNVLNKTLNRIPRANDTEIAMVVELLDSLVALELQEGNLEIAEAKLSEAVALGNELGSERGSAENRREKRLAELRFQLGRPGGLEAELLDSLTSHRSNPDNAPSAYQSVLERYVAVLLSQRRYDEAGSLIQEGREHRAKFLRFISVPDQWDAMGATVQSRIRNS
ncbi:hypothetical protein [Ruegeria sp.]|uniref:hypothetical protein n=1 Tax=Ruegeria sp. TaxID=1879320 RepID=UPI003B590D67